MRSTLQIPRIVCMACPAVVRIDYSEQLPAEDAWLVSLWCHDKRIVAKLDAAFVASMGEQTTIPLEGFRQLEPDVITDMLERAEAVMLQAAARAEMLQRFIREGMQA